MDHSKFTFTSPSKKENSSCLGRIPSEKPRFVCLPVQTRAVWPNGGVLSLPFQLYELLCNQVDACDQGFVSTMLWLKFRSGGYPSCVLGLCSSSEDAKVRLGWLVVVHDVPGPLAVFRERRVGKSQWRAVHVRRDQTFVFLRDSTGAVLSTSRGVYHLRCPYITFSSGSRSAESFEQLTLVQKLVHARS